MTFDRPDLTIDTERGAHGTVKSFDELRDERTGLSPHPIPELTHFLTAAEAPLLAELWDNEEDAVYDDA